jgi:O-antigen/teichoic acid export membrane protein
VQARADKAAICSLIYIASLVLGASLLYLWDALTSHSAFGLMAGASLISSLPFLPFFVALKSNPGKKDNFRVMLADQWAYAKWSGPSSILLWIPLNVFYLVVPYAGGLQSTAAFKALSNLINPLVQSNQALTILMLPKLSRLFATDDRPRVLRYMRSLSVLFLAASVFYWLTLVIFRREILQLLYAQQYTHLADILPFVGLVPIFMGLTSILASGLRAMEQPNRVFGGYMAGAMTALIIGVTFSLFGGITGAFLGQALAYIAMAIVLGWNLRDRK